MSPDHDYSWKLVFGGAGGAGKTTLIQRFLSDEFSPDTKMTVGVQFHTGNLRFKEKRFLLMLWDLGGQEKFRFIQDQYIQGSVGGFVFFDMSRLGTLQQVENWVKMFRKNLPPTAPIVLVGSKLDLIKDEERADIDALANQYVEDLGLTGYTQTSSKTGTNVYEAVTYVVDLLLFNLSQGIKVMGV
ncbi:MAG: Rab family GTPase [Candidatus Hodarchaeota archaeon]